MSTETLRQAFKHGASARLNGQPREPTYDNPAHRAQWLKGWDCTDSNQRGREARHAITRDSMGMQCPVNFYSTPCSKSRDYIEKIWKNLNDPFYPKQVTVQLTGDCDITSTKETNSMKSTLAYIFASMLPEVIGVKVTFAGPFDKGYTYKALKSQNIEVGQFVVVDSPNSGLTVVKVKEVVAFDDLDPRAYQGYKWIVGPVSTGDYSAVTSKEQAFQAKVIELQRKAQREQAVAALAEQVGGLDALKAIMAELSAPTEAQPAPSIPPAAPSIPPAAPAAE